MGTCAEANIYTWDYVVLIGYFVGVLAVGLWSSYKPGTNVGSVGGFFLAGRDMHWLLVGASLFASNIGSGHYVGLAGSGAAGGIAVAGFELNAIFVLMMLGWLFVPVYYAAGVYTMPEYLKRRFGGRRIQVYLSCLALLLYVFTKISADLFAGALFLEQAFKLPLYPSIGVLLLIAMVFTVTGGLTAVIWTDAVQVVIMIIGAFILMIMSFVAIGGYAGLTSRYFTEMPPVPTSLNLTDKCVSDALPRTDALSMLRAFDADLPWTGMTFGLTVSAVWYWCSDQVIVQRALSAKTYSHAKAGCVFGAALKFLPLWLLIFPGMISRVLYKDCIVCYGPDDCDAKCGIRTGCSNIAYPQLVIKLLPEGLTGLMLACMLSALMSSLTSIFNSSSTIFTMDIWPLIRRKASEVELLIVGRLFVVVLVGVSILWIPIIEKSTNSQLFNYIQSVTSYLAPPVCAVYVLAIFVPRVNEPGAFAGLMFGLVVGLIRFIMEIAYGNPDCMEVDNRPAILTSVHYLHFGVLLFIISVAVTLGVSMITPPIDKKHLRRLTFWSRWDELETEPMEMNDMKSSDETDHGKSAQVDISMMPGWRRLIYKLLGLEKKARVAPANGAVDTVQQDTGPKDTRSALIEDRATKWFLDGAAIVVMAGAVFLYVFYL